MPAGLIPGSGLFWAQGTSANSLQGRLVTAAIWPFTKSVPQVSALCLPVYTAVHRLGYWADGVAVRQGAATEVYAALAPGIESKSGGFFK